jgi:CrcB protein
MTVLWIGLGGFLGANARYFAGKALLERFGTGFPWGTLAVNVSGSLAIGLILEFIAERAVADPAYRLLLVVGFLGGYTTFSSYAFETVSLVESDRWARAGTYILASNGLSLVACFAGMHLARRIA